MNYKFKTKPYAHQLTALEKSWNKETYAYFMEMGTGKTKVLIDNAAMLVPAPDPSAVAPPIEGLDDQAVPSYPTVVATFEGWYPPNAKAAVLVAPHPINPEVPVSNTPPVVQDVPPYSSVLVYLVELG